MFEPGSSAIPGCHRVCSVVGLGHATTQISGSGERRRNSHRCTSRRRRAGDPGATSHNRYRRRLITSSACRGHPRAHATAPTTDAEHVALGTYRAPPSGQSAPVAPTADPGVDGPARGVARHGLAGSSAAKTAASSGSGTVGGEVQAASLVPRDIDLSAWCAAAKLLLPVLL